MTSIKERSTIGSDTNKYRNANRKRSLSNRKPRWRLNFPRVHSPVWPLFSANVPFTRLHSYSLNPNIYILLSRCNNGFERRIRRRRRLNNAPNRWRARLPLTFYLLNGSVQRTLRTPHNARPLFVPDAEHFAGEFIFAIREDLMRIPFTSAESRTGLRREWTKNVCGKCERTQM